MSKASNAFSQEFPDIAHQWHPSKNAPLTPDDVTSGSNKKVWWVCDMGHEWESMVSKRTKRNQGCPYCSGRIAIPGVNDIATTHPEVSKQWNYEKNSSYPQETKAGSNKKVWWVCHNGHEYQASPNSRINKGTSCPYCSGHKVLQGYNDLATTHPDLVKQWSSSNDLLPQEISSGSSKKVKWKCSKGHEWDDSVVHRSHGRGCPYCAGKRVGGDNSFAHHYPDFAQQWHTEKNDISPDEVSHQSGMKAWFICDNGHEYQSRIADRKRFGCPFCSHRISSGESEVIDYVKSLLPGRGISTSVNSVIPPYELDIYIPEKGVAIEFNGLYWHAEDRGKDKNYHYNKWKMCADQGIQLITIWEDEWRDKQEIVKSMIAHKLRVSQSDTVYARNTHVVQITDLSIAKDFLDKNHIQGYTSASMHVGLAKSDGGIVAVSSWRKNQNTLYLERYSTSCSVVGGMGKLLKEGKKYAYERMCSSIVTFSDNCVSDGGLYSALGFKKDKDLPPDYKYTIGGKRIHKFNYRIKRFKEDPNLRYVEGMTERELARLNGLDRIWDCGKTRWIMEM